jgi:DNA-binding CsgD family transcriptional regulator
MAVQISSQHPTLLLKNKIQKISHAFFETLGFSYFQHLRCFQDGSISLLTNNTSLFEEFSHVDNSALIFSSFKSENINSHSYWFLWDEALPQHPVQLAKQKYNIHNGLTLVRRYKNYYDMIAVALPYHHDQASIFYLNKLRVIEQFFNDFEHENKNLIELITQNRILLLPSQRDINYKNICLLKGRISIRGKSGVTYVTTQELNCLRLLFQGYSHKKIAQLLNISTRTVETYLLRIKHRTGYDTQCDLNRLMSYL